MRAAGVIRVSTEKEIKTLKARVARLEEALRRIINISSHPCFDVNRNDFPKWGVLLDDARTALAGKE